MLTRVRRSICAALIVSLTGLGLPLPASSAMVSTAAVLGTDRAYVNSVLDRAEVRAQLEANGVSPAEVKARVAALSDTEASQLAQRLQSLPAGGDALSVILGIAVIALIVLIITDLMGITKIFPWSK